MGNCPGLSLTVPESWGEKSRLFRPTRGDRMPSMKLRQPSLLARIGSPISRRQEGRVIAGVAGGIADRLGLTDLYVRAAFVTLTFIWEIGIVLYLVGWAVLARTADSSSEVHPASSEQRLALALIFVSSLVLLQGLGFWVGDRFWPWAALIFGIAFLLDRRDIDPRSAILALFDPGSGRFRSRAVIGVLLLVAGLLLLVLTSAPDIGRVLLAVLVTGVGMAVLLGPWVWRLVSELTAEQGERIRQEERAEMAAHLHD